MRIIKAIAMLSLAIFATAFAQEDEKPEPGFNEATFKGLEMRSIGPAFMSGRIADIVIDPTDPSTWYVARRGPRCSTIKALTQLVAWPLTRTTRTRSGLAQVRTSAVATLVTATVFIAAVTVA